MMGCPVSGSIFPVSRSRPGDPTTRVSPERLRDPPNRSPASPSPGDRVSSVQNVPTREYISTVPAPAPPAGSEIATVSPSIALDSPSAVESPNTPTGSHESGNPFRSQSSVGSVIRSQPSGIPLRLQSSLRPLLISVASSIPLPLQSTTCANR